MTINPVIFKAYDIRGIYPTEINEEAVDLIGRAYAKHFEPKTVVVGSDVRMSSPSLKSALIAALTESGTAVIDIGTISTDMLYFAVVHLGTDGGITVSASHNPAEYNGLKMVLRGAFPISSETGLFELRDLIIKETEFPTATAGSVSTFDIMPEYLKHLKKFAKLENCKPYHIVANGNYGMAGTVVQKLFEGTPLTLQLLNGNPDGTFPKGRPDPMYATNALETIARIQSTGADLGVAWDADADRCFFYDETGRAIPSYYITALLASILLRDQPDGKVIFDPRLTWAIEAAVRAAGGIPIVNKAGHTFIKARMRQEDALFAGEVSAHYYFRDNYYCDNGMIPLLLVLEEMSVTGKKLSELITPWQEHYFTITETNFTVSNPLAIIATAKEHYLASGGKLEEIDGVSIEFDDWRFNLRSSNTEPLLRLNLEAKNEKCLEEKFAEIKQLVEET